MGLLELLNHLLNLAAPALIVASLAAALARIVVSGDRPKPAFWATLAINFVVNLAVLLGGLWYFGHDGKVTTYATMVLVGATAQWLLLGGWKT